MKTNMTKEQFKTAQEYWSKKEQIKMPEEQLKLAIEAYINENNTCALATGTGDYVRCTPIEYSYHDGKFWMFSEGGKKFIGLEKNDNVSLAIFDKYDGFGNLRSLQIMGTAEIVEPFSDSYNAHAEYKKIPIGALQNLQQPMNLICVTPVKTEALFSEFKKDGYSSRQTYVHEKAGEQDDIIDYLYKITVEIDDEKIRTLGEHDVDNVYRVVRNTFAKCDFTERSKDNRRLIFTIQDCKDAFSDVGLATNTLYDSWIGKYIKRMDWYDADDGSTEDMLKEIRGFDGKYKK